MILFVIPGFKITAENAEKILKTLNPTVLISDSYHSGSKQLALASIRTETKLVIAQPWRTMLSSELKNLNVPTNVFNESPTQFFDNPKPYFDWINSYATDFYGFSRSKEKITGFYLKNLLLTKKFYEHERNL